VFIDSFKSVPQIFEPDYYQQLYDVEERHGWAQGMREAMAALLRQPLAGRGQLRALDIGCGTGYLLKYVARHYPLRGEPVGIDVSSYALKFCRQRGASQLALASAVQLPFASAAFDLIICIDTLQHLSPAGADRIAAREFVRLLRPGGVLYLRTNSARGHVPVTGVDPDQYRRYRLETVTAMLTEAGLKVERATYVNAIPGAWAALRERVRARQLSAAPIGPGLSIRPYPPHLVWLNSVMRGVLSFEAWLMGGLQLDLPFGHSTAFVARRLAETGG
jgi:ubiquinone/menaquinone biosynthesis C-methylase UbiE